MNNADGIRRAATALFASRGFDGTSLSAIAEAVGVTKPTLLYHYPSKEDLRRAVLDEVFGHFRERLPRLLQAVSGGLGRFEALTRELTEFFEADPDRARLLLREVLDHPDHMRRVLAKEMRPWVQLVAGVVREGQALGVVEAGVDPEAYLVNVNLSVLTTIALRAVGNDLLGAGGPAGLPAYERQMSELLRMHRRALFREPLPHAEEGRHASGTSPANPAGTGHAASRPSRSAAASRGRRRPASAGKEKP